MTALEPLAVEIAGHLALDLFEATRLALPSGPRSNSMPSGVTEYLGVLPHS